MSTPTNTILIELPDNVLYVAERALHILGNTESVHPRWRAEYRRLADVFRRARRTVWADLFHHMPPDGAPAPEHPLLVAVDVDQALTAARALELLAELPHVADVLARHYLSVAGNCRTAAILASRAAHREEDALPALSAPPLPRPSAWARLVALATGNEPILVHVWSIALILIAVSSIGLLGCWLGGLAGLITATCLSFLLGKFVAESH